MTRSTPSWDNVHRANFEAAAFSEFRWIATARSLYESAKKLEPGIAAVWESYRQKKPFDDNRLLPDHYQGPYFMLLAYAIENLLKAAAVTRWSARYKADFRTTGKFPKELQKHDLVALTQLVELSIDGGEEDLLRRLTQNAVWHGRYPAPLVYPAMSGTEAFSDGSEYSVSWFGGQDVERLNALVLSLPARLGLNDEAWQSAAS